MLATEVIRRVKRIELITRRLVNPALTGAYHSVFKGRGMDFDEVAPYLPGDDVRFIDWNVSARSGDLHVKRFVEERELTVQILVDASASMRFGTGEESKRTLAAQVAALLAVLAVRNNDRVGLTIFDDAVRVHLTPRKGKRHIMRLITEVLEHRPGVDARTALEVALTHTARSLHRRAIVFVLSDFLEEGWEQGLGLLARRHDVVPVVFEDPLEDAPTRDPVRGTFWSNLLHGGLLQLRDLESGQRWVVDTASVAARVGWPQRIQAMRQRRQERFVALGLDSMKFHTHATREKDLVEPLAGFFRRRTGRRR
jgi:uncharacterized protein (DUF58 family)